MMKYDLIIFRNDIYLLKFEKLKDILLILSVITGFNVF